MATEHATGKFRLKNWDEKAYDEDGPKLTRVEATVTYEGEMEGEGKLQYLMMYREDETASYVSMERFTGRIGDREGSLVLQGTGEFKDGAATVDWTVVPGSGTGDLRDISGKGGFKSIHGNEQTEVELDYETG
jgi:hypothetical protein